MAFRFSYLLLQIDSLIHGHSNVSRELGRGKKREGRIKGLMEGAQLKQAMTHSKREKEKSVHRISQEFMAEKTFQVYEGKFAIQSKTGNSQWEGDCNSSKRDHSFE